MSEISQFSQGLHEECGVFGMYDKTGATDMVSAVLQRAVRPAAPRAGKLRHRRERWTACFYKRRELGLVNDVFTKRRAGGPCPAAPICAIGHVPLCHRGPAPSAPMRSRL